MDLSLLASEHNRNTKIGVHESHASSPSLSLNDLARSHLQGSNPTSGAGNAFHIPNLFNASTPSTSTTQTTPNQPFTIPNLFGDLKSLKTQPLTGDIGRQPASDSFQIPDLFGSGVKTILKNKNNNDDKKSTSQGEQINLMSALTLSTNSKSDFPGPLGTKSPIRKNGFQDVCREVLSQTQDLSHYLSNLSLDNHPSQSSLATVICTQWSVTPSDRKILIPSSLSHPTDIQPFKFDTPSPDDIVRKAQSRVFRTELK